MNKKWVFQLHKNLHQEPIVRHSLITAFYLQELFRGEFFPTVSKDKMEATFKRIRDLLINS